MVVGVRILRAAGCGVTEVQRPEEVASEGISHQNGHGVERNGGRLSVIKTPMIQKGAGLMPASPGGSMDVPERAEQRQGNAEQENNLSESKEEARKIRRLQIMISMVTSVIS